MDHPGLLSFMGSSFVGGFDASGTQASSSRIRANSTRPCLAQAVRRLSNEVRRIVGFGSCSISKWLQHQGPCTLLPWGEDVATMTA